MVLPEMILNSSQWLKEEDFFDFLDSRVGILDGVSICGGEPTLHRSLPEFCEVIKSLGFKVKLDTNGQNPSMLELLLKKHLVDYIAMDVKHVWEKYESLVQIPINNINYKKSIQIIMKYAPNYEFRTTVIGGIHSEDDIEKISSYIHGAKNYYLQNYRWIKTLDSTFTGYSFYPSELESLKKIASRNVEKCSIRI
jgi:pyruvate formate lyase activating enzyme